MSVLPNQTNCTTGDAFFWKVDASTITAKSFISDRLLTNTLSTGSVIVGNISTTGSITVAGDITATGTMTAHTVDSGYATSYFNTTQYLTVEQVLNVTGVANIPELGGVNATFSNMALGIGAISSIRTTNIVLDGNSLDTGGAGVGAVLLLNGYPIATTSTSISSLVNWSLYPAISTLYMNNNTIEGAADVQTNILNAGNIYTYDLEAVNQIVFGTNLFGSNATLLHISTVGLDAQVINSAVGSVSSLTTSTLAVNNAIFNTTTTAQSFTTALEATNITSVTGNISDFAANSANVGSANINSITVSNETVTGTLTVGEIRGPNGFINAEGANRIRIRVLGSSDVFSSPELGLEAGGGNRGLVNITAKPGSGGVQGECRITAQGGTAAGYATGGLLELTATKGTAVLGTANTSRVGIAADSVTSYAGGPTPFVGLLGYNFMYGLLGVNLVAGTPPTLPNVPGTVYLYGLNPLGFGTSGGVRVQNGMSIDYITPYPQGFIAPEYDLIIKGNPAGQMVTLSNVRYVFGSNALATGFQDVNTVNLSATNLNGTNIFGTTLTASNLNGLVGNISSINTQNAAISRLFNVSTINGFTIDQLISSVTPPQFVSTVSTFNQLFTSSIQFNGAVGTVAQIQSLIGISTIDGFTIAQLVSTTTPTVFPSTLSSFDVLAANQFTVSSILGTSLNLVAPGGILLNGVQPLSTLTSTFNLLYASLFYATSISSALLSVSSINGYNFSQLVNQDTVSTFSNIYVSDAIIYNQTSDRLVVSSINGFNTSQFLSTPGSPATVSTFNQLFTSSLGANTISTSAITFSTLNGFTINQLVNNPIVSTFNQFFTSSIAVNGISSATASIQQLTNVSTINNITIAQFVSSISPPIPAPSTFNQVFTSSLAANTITNYQTSFLDMTAPAISITAASVLDLEATQCNINITSANLFLTATSGNVNIASSNQWVGYSSNTVQLYTTATAPAVIAGEIAIVAGGPASLQSIGAVALRGNGSALVDGNSNTTVTGLATTVQGSNTLNLVTPSLLLNGSPFPLETLSSFQQLFTSSIANSAASPNLSVTAGNLLNLQANYTTIQGSQQISINSPQEIRVSSSNLTMDVPSGQSLIYLNQDDGIEATTNKNFVVTATSNIALNSATLTINGAPYSPGISSFTTLATDVLRNNNTNSLTITAPFGVNLSTGNQVLITSGEVLTYSRSITDFFAANGIALSTQVIRLDAPITNVLATLNAPQIFTSSINGVAYTPATPTVSTFQQLFTSSFVVNTINGAAYPPPATTVSTFSNLYVANIFNDAPVGNNITLTATQALAENAVSITRTATGTIADTAPSGYTLNSQNTITISTIGSLNLNSVPPSNSIINPVQFATGQVFPQPGLGLFQFLTNNQAVTWTNVLITDNYANIYYNGAWGPNISLTFPITVTIGTSGYYRLSIEYAGTISEYLVQYQPGGTILYGIVTPTTANFTWGQGSREGTINLNARQTNITGVSSINLTSPSLLWNGNPIGSGGGPTVSTFSNLYTSNLYVTASTVTSNLVVFDRIFNPSLVEPLEIQSAKSVNLIGDRGMVLGTGSNDIVFTAGILDPGAQNVTIAFCDLNLSNNNINNVDVLYAGNINTTNTSTTNLFASNAIVSSINGQPYSPGVSTFTNLYTNNLYVTASTITSNMYVQDTIYGSNLTVYGKQSLGLLGELAMVLQTSSNDIVLSAGILHPGNQNVKISFCDLNLDNNSINNVDVLYAGNINTTNTTTTNLYATTGSISSLTVSTINTYPVHMAFGSAWATTDPASLALLAGIVNYVDIPTRQAFNFVPDTTGNVFSLLPSEYPLNRGIYQLNARCTFSNGDSNVATVSSWIDTVPNVSTTGTAISRCVIQIEPNRIGTTYMVCQSLVDEFISVNCFTTSDNVTLYYDPGDGSNTPPSYAMNLTAHQLYQYENRFEEYNWPPNPIPPPHPT